MSENDNEEKGVGRRDLLLATGVVAAVGALGAAPARAQDGGDLPPDQIELYVPPGAMGMVRVIEDVNHAQCSEITVRVSKLRATIPGVSMVGVLMK